MGNYAIAAGLVLVDNGVRITVFGHNTVASNDPRGHAEMNAFGLAYKLGTLAEPDRVSVLEGLIDEGTVEIASANAGCGRYAHLYSTVEPCPMCTVAAINAQVSVVTYAVEDPLAGALAPERLARLAPLWSRTARNQNLRVQRCSTDQAAPLNRYLPTDLFVQLQQTFEVSREVLDGRLAENGFFDFGALTSGARRLLDVGRRQP